MYVDWFIHPLERPQTACRLSAFVRIDHFQEVAQGLGGGGIQMLASLTVSVALICVLCKMLLEVNTEQETALLPRSCQGDT